ncbi:substrate-binding domain-containing protein [Cohnella faecalis]|uniref:ABC transporter substrate-binding protein n=1 Tax=Cohnella faecalis TaxID=2315694 RepID=A0A398CP97_9BACL|nr:substrate-binding domain-containing protein [Cohnella faecalis]RIE02538.1 ABC transporter substrate-binding protein [Cohnella faecalis]
MMRIGACMLVSLVLMAGLLNGCSRKGEIRTAPERQTNVALIVKDRSGEFWKTVKMGAEAAAKEFNVNLMFDGTDSETDASEQSALVEKYVAYGANAIVLASEDYVKLAKAVEAADRKGASVIAIESEVDSPKVRSFIGIDNYEAGRQAARKMSEVAGAKGSFVIIGHSSGDRNSAQREKGIRDEWAATPGIKIEETVYCGSEKGSCKKKTEELLMRQGQLDGILALNAAASAEAASEIEAMNRQGKVKLVAFDNSPEELEWLQEGVIQATVIQNPFSMGYLGVKTAVDAINREKVAKRTVTETKVIDAESMFWSDNQKMLFPFVQ